MEECLFKPSHTCCLSLENAPVTSLLGAFLLVLRSDGGLFGKGGIECPLLACGFSTADTPCLTLQGKHSATGFNQLF